nr:polyprenyl synthetase family protein [uncultured Enterobacter sp.]
MSSRSDSYFLHNSEPGMLKKSIDEHLTGLLPEADPQDVVSLAMREGVMAPGKRIRPVLMLLAARDLGFRGQAHTLLDLACAVEMIHTASLMLDDMPCMDDADLRRGQPTTHKKYGESVAILASIGLLTKAFGLASASGDLAGERCARVVSELASAVGVQGLVLGQFRDLREGCGDRTTDAILSTNHLKTGILFSAMLQIIAIAADASEVTRQKLREFALDFGQAFQLVDDLCDGLVSTGKDPHQDKGKSTLVNVLGKELARQKLYEHIQRAEGHLNHACLKGNAIREFMHAWLGNKLAETYPIMKIA